MRQLLETLMDSANAHADYADARLIHTQSESIATRNGAVDHFDRDDEHGVGIRVRIGGAWGFAATRGHDRGDAEGALKRAVAIARAQPAAPPAPLAPVVPARGTHAGP